jgi:hypothetical protein
VSTSDEKYAVCTASGDGAHIEIAHTLDGVKVVGTSGRLSITSVFVRGMTETTVVTIPGAESYKLATTLCRHASGPRAHSTCVDSERHVAHRSAH